MNLSQICHTKKTLSILPLDRQELLKKLAHATANISNESVAFKQSFKESMEFSKINVHSDVFEILEKGDSIEAWTADTKFLFAIGDFMTRSNYAIEDLATKDWATLFDRDQFTGKRILRCVENCVLSGKPSHNVADWHIVTEKETKEKASCLIKIKIIAPFHSGSNYGIIAVVRAKDVPKPALDH